MKADWLMRHLLDSGYATQVTEPMYLHAGDLVFADLQGKGRIHHTFIVRSIKEQVILAAHNRDYYNLKLSDVLARYPNGTFIYVHIIDWVPMFFQSRTYGKNHGAIKQIYTNGSLGKENSTFFDPRVYYALSHNNSKWRTALSGYLNYPTIDVPTDLWNHFASPKTWRPHLFYDSIPGNIHNVDDVMFNQSFTLYENEVKRYVGAGGSVSCCEKATKVNRNWILFTCDYMEAGELDPESELPEEPEQPQPPASKEIEVKYCMVDKKPGEVRITMTMNDDSFSVEPSIIESCGSGWSKQLFLLKFDTANVLNITPKGGTGYPFKVREQVAILPVEGQPGKLLSNKIFRIQKDLGHKTTFRIR